MPHSRIQVELGFILQAGTCQILNFAQNPRQSQSVQGTELNWGGDTAQKRCIPGGGTPHILSEQGLIGGTYPGWGEHRTNFVDGANNWVGTPHNIERNKSKYQIPSL